MVLMIEGLSDEVSPNAVIGMQKPIIYSFAKKIIKIKDLFLLYLDANNLSGYAMSKYLHYGGFKWYYNTN